MAVPSGQDEGSPGAIDRGAEAVASLRGHETAELGNVTLRRQADCTELLKLGRQGGR